MPGRYSMVSFGPILFPASADPERPGAPAAARQAGAVARAAPVAATAPSESWRCFGGDLPAATRKSFFGAPATQPGGAPISVKVRTYADQGASARDLTEPAVPRFA